MSDQIFISDQPKARLTGPVGGPVNLPVYLRPWPVTFITLLASFMAAVSLFKVQPLIPLIMDSFDIGEAKAGLLMAVFSLSGIVLAIPGGMLSGRFGVYKTGGLGLAFLMVGGLVAVIGINYGSMFASRLIEGIGLALLSIIGVVVVALVFPPERRGLPMGLICLYVSFGELVPLNVAPRIAEAWGWQGFWWICLTVTIFAFVVWGLCFRCLESHYLPQIEEGEKRPASIKQVFVNPKVWLLTISFAFYMIAYSGVFIFWPTFLNLVQLYELGTAASLVSLISIVSIPASFGCGALSDKLGSRRLVIVPAMFINAVFFFFIPAFGSVLLIVALIVVGVTCIAIPVLTFAAATELYEESSLGSVAVSLVTAGQNVGLFVGPAVMGILVEKSGWATAFQTMAAITVVALIIACFCRVK
jgi:predicted MFS family arabinose efflux permease